MCLEILITSMLPKSIDASLYLVVWTEAADVKNGRIQMNKCCPILSPLENFARGSTVGAN